MSDDGQSSNALATASQGGSSYGSVGQSNASGLLLEQAVLPSSDSQTSDGGLSPRTAERIQAALRSRMETLLALAILRRKYRDNILVCMYFIFLIGMTPMCIYLFLESSLFVSLYLTYTSQIHFTVQVMNIIILYLYIATAFDIRSIFNTFNIHPLVGNVFIAIFAGSLFATECVDQVAVYLNLAHFDNYGAFQPTPGTVAEGGTSPDSLLFLLLLLGTIAATFFAVLNALHFLYYSLEYYRTVGSTYDELQENGSAHIV